MPTSTCSGAWMKILLQLHLSTFHRCCLFSDASAPRRGVLISTHGELANRLSGLCQLCEVTMTAKISLVRHLSEGSHRWKKGKCEHWGRIWWQTVSWAALVAGRSLASTDPSANTHAHSAIVVPDGRVQITWPPERMATRHAAHTDAERTQTLGGVFSGKAADTEE